MAYDSYDNLKVAVLGQSHRKDLGVKFNDFLTMAEVEIRTNPQSALLLNLNEVTSTELTSTTTRSIPLPTGLISSRNISITINTSVCNLEFRTPEQMIIRTGVGTPWFFTVANNEIQFDVLPEIVYSIGITYTSDLVPLSTINQTNNVLTKYPNIYLYACLKQLFLFAEEIDMASTYDGLFSEAIESGNTSERNIKYTSQPQETVGWAP